MELIASLREQLDRLCAQASVESNWLLEQLSRGLRERYGALACGFVRQREPGSAQLLGLCDATGRILIPLSDDFQPDRRHPRAPVTALATESWLETDAFGRWGVSDVDDCFAESRSVFVSPWLIDRPADWHMLILSPIAAPAFLRQDRGLSVNANLLATNLLRSLDAQRLQRANAWIEREMDEIARLQRLLQPEARIELDGVEVAFASHIYHYAGGDYFDVPRLTHLVPVSERVTGADHFGAIIADVSGHGPSAAVEAAMLDAIMRTYPGPVAAGPHAVAAYLNRNLFTRRPRAAFITAFICNWFPATRELHHASCGHPPPIVLRPDGECFELPVERGIPLRIEQDYQWQSERQRMEPGEVLVMYTDGVTESRPLGGPELGREGLLKLVRRAGSTEPQTILATIEAGIDEHLSGRPRQDDQTIIVIRFG